MDMRKDLAATLHAVLCNKQHGEDMIMLNERVPNQCYWYLEDNIVDTWQQEDHLIWLYHATDVLEILGASGKSEEEIRDAIDAVLQLCRSLIDLKFINAKLEKKIVKLIASYVNQKP